MPQRPLLPDRLPLRLQDLRAPEARFCLAVRRFMLDLSGDLNGRRLLLACSGGADSLCLLLVLRWLAPNMGFSLQVAHLDHGLRREAPAEAKALEAACRRLGLPLHVQRANLLAMPRHKGEGIEEAGRNARYAFLASLRERLRVDWVCTAHQRDDVLEDMLIRFTRGAGWPGLAGMPALCPERRLLRPLLMTGRKEIEGFLNTLRVQPVEDPSNESTDFLRNRIRHKIVPLLLEENPSLGDAAESLWRLGQDDAAYWDALLPSLLPDGEDGEGGEGDAVLIPASFRTQPSAVRLRAYMFAVRRLRRAVPGLAVHALASLLRKLDEAFADPDTPFPKEFDFPGDIRATLTARGVEFHPVAKGVSPIRGKND